MGKSRNTYEGCPIGAISDSLVVSSFLHLAVKLQLDVYVKPVVRRLYAADDITFLAELFQIAATEYCSTLGPFRRDNPSLSLIEVFLELGINPNQALRINPNKYHYVNDTMTIWQSVIPDSATRPDLLELLLRYGADPFVSELAKYEHSHDF